MFEHNNARSSQSPSFNYVGENLAARTGTADFIQDINSWYNEVTDYNFNTNSCNGVCGHYTQVNSVVDFNWNKERIKMSLVELLLC